MFWSFGICLGCDFGILRNNIFAISLLVCRFYYTIDIFSHTLLWINPTYRQVFTSLYILMQKRRDFRPSKSPPCEITIQRFGRLSVAFRGLIKRATLIFHPVFVYIPCKHRKSLFGRLLYMGFPLPRQTPIV